MPYQSDEGDQLLPQNNSNSPHKRKKSIRDSFRLKTPHFFRRSEGKTPLMKEGAPNEVILDTPSTTATRHTKKVKKWTAGFKTFQNMPGQDLDEKVSFDQPLFGIEQGKTLPPLSWESPLYTMPEDEEAMEHTALLATP